MNMRYGVAVLTFALSASAVVQSHHNMLDLCRINLWLVVCLDQTQTVGFGVLLMHRGTLLCRPITGYQSRVGSGPNSSHAPWSILSKTQVPFSNSLEP